MSSAAGHRHRVSRAPRRELVEARERYADRFRNPARQAVGTPAALEVSVCLSTRSSLS